MSPEQIRGEPVEPTSDIYSTGCVIYQCLTGAVPFAGDSISAVFEGHLNEAISPESLDALEAKIRDLVARRLDKRPADRVPDVATLREICLRTIDDLSAESGTQTVG
jgi:eukaryotic-like serine/threonine-protein kinase